MCVQGMVRPSLPPSIQSRKGGRKPGKNLEGRDEEGRGRGQSTGVLSIREALQRERERERERESERDREREREREALNTQTDKHTFSTSNVLILSPAVTGTPEH